MRERKLVFGAGINDADYFVFKTEKIEGKWKIVWSCPYYIRWEDMIRRCHYDRLKIKHPSYAECKTVPEWIYFSNFKAWMETQDWQGKELDKDILFPGNKIYGPDTCVFVNKNVNTFIIESNATRGEWPIGVNFNKARGKFVAFCRDIEHGVQKYLGYFITAEEAHEAWLTEKRIQAKILASEQTDKRVSEAIIKRYEEYKRDDN